MTTTAGRAPSDKGKNSRPREVATSHPREVRRSHPREVYSSRGCEIFRPPHTSHSPLAPGEILRFRYTPLRMTDATSHSRLTPPLSCHPERSPKGAVEGPPYEHLQRKGDVSTALRSAQHDSSLSLPELPPSLTPSSRAKPAGRSRRTSLRALPLAPGETLRLRCAPLRMTASPSTPLPPPRF